MYVSTVITQPKRKCLLSDIFCFKNKSGDIREIEADLSYTYTDSNLNWQVAQS